MSSSSDNALYSMYGAYELKAKYQRNFMYGTLVTVVMVLSIVGTGYIISALSDKAAASAPSVIIKTIADLGPPPSIAKKPPQVKVQQPNVAAPKVGIPKPVADDEVIDEDVVIATREELADIVAPDVTSGVDGDIVVDIDDDYIPSSEEFVAVEIYPEMIFREKPAYPRLAQELGLEGKVWVKALVNEDGNVMDVILAKSSGITSLDDAAVAAARKCRFKPGIQNGRPIKVWVTWDFDFKIQG